MQKAPSLLNDDGTASVATMVLMSHHGFRRDLVRFSTALQQIAKGDSARAGALLEEWQQYRATLHGHHEAEDFGIFPELRKQQSSLGSTIDQLTTEHRRIDPLLDRGDSVFANLPGAHNAAAALVADLGHLLGGHLEREEREIIPHLRQAKEFPPPPREEDAEIYARGFAWSSHGIARDVLNRVYELLPEVVAAKLAAARADFDARCLRVWGNVQAGASLTAIPEG